METGVLKVQPRKVGGSKEAGRVRRKGGIPAVLYGGGKDVAHVTVGAEEFDILLRKHRRVFRIEGSGPTLMAFLKNVQHDALGDGVVHIDFLRIDETKKMRVNVPLEFKGHPKGLGAGGEFVHPMNEVEVECLPTQIPESIRVNVDHLDLHMSITAKELTLPTGVALASSPDSIVCTVHQKGLEPEPTAAGAEGGPQEPEMIAKRPASEEEGDEAGDKEKK